MRFRKIYNFFTVLVCFIIVSNNAFSQLIVDTAQSAAVLAATLAGPGVTILNPKDTCLGVANGTFTVTGTLLDMTNGIVLTNGYASACAGPEGPPPGTASYNLHQPGDPQTAALLPAGTATYDACILEFDVVAAGDSIGFNYQFGSQEYYSAVCSDYNDAFAFFISGPGITGAPDIALVPGTTIPVEINSVNDGTPGSSGGRLSNCTSLGAGSPFTSYYINNVGGTLLAYVGYTTKFRAVHAVTACDTYHIRLSVVDAGNAIYDSGVFLEGGSLTTNSYSFNHSDSIGAFIDGVDHTIVKGCSPTTLNIVAANANPTATVLNLSFGGTATNGVDVATIPSTVTLPADSTSVSIDVQAIPTPAGGAKTLTVYINGACNVLDSVSINILDTPSAYILTPDTSVCLGQSFQINVEGTGGLSYDWTPPTGLSSTTVMEPLCTPTANTIYTMSAILPGSGCPDIERTIAVNIASGSIDILTNDTTVCPGASVGLQVNGAPGDTYSWSPPATLNNPDIQDPVATPIATTTYTLNASSSSGGCNAIAMVTITVANPAITILTPDTTVCEGMPINVRVNGNPAFTYSWSPSVGISNPNIIDPVATPSVNTIYIVTATDPGTPCFATAQFTASVIQMSVSATSLLQACNTGIIFNVLPTDPNYIYVWTGPSGFIDSTQNPDIINPSLTDAGLYTVTVTNSSNGCIATDTTSVLINAIASTQLTNVTPSQSIAYGSSIKLNADNAAYYWWQPSDGSLNNRNINDPVAMPLQNTTYTVYGMDSSGCVDSAKITIDVITDSITIPSAFTPNNDGLNDIFRPIGMKYQKMVLFSVYNRWGQEVFTTNSKETGWDGTFNGVPQPLGVYNYLLIVSLDDGTNQFYKGNVTLIR